MACVEGRTFTWPPLLSAQGSRTVKTLDLFDALRLEDRGDLPLPHWVLESKGTLTVSSRRYIPM
jgi:hypothetical protein